MKVLFLDRDGVINVENKDSYILKIEDFIFEKGVPEAINILNRFFDKVIVATNQRCVGRGLITDEGLESIHNHMINELKNHDAEIHDVFYAPSIEDHHPDRKPNIGMGQQALAKYPDLDFSNSVMVGNNLSDMKFGKGLGMKTVFLSTTSEYIADTHNSLCDEHYHSLLEYAKNISAKQDYKQ